MDQQEVTTFKPYQVAGLAGLALLASALVAVGILYTVRSKMRTDPSDPVQAPDQPERASIQPAVDTVAPAQVPDHFSESLIVPGFTRTGSDVQQDDDSYGRSPEGV